MNIHYATARYREIYDEFALLITHGVSLIELQAGHRTEGSRDSYGEKIFSKMVCHGLSLKQLSPSLNPVERELWDISSNYAISRTLVETYEALSYISIEPISDLEREFRVLMWKLHAQERRAEMLRLIGSNHSEIPKVHADINELRSAILGHPVMPKENKALAGKISRSETPPYHTSRKERDICCGINHNYHSAVIMHLSSYVHTHPFSIHQLFDFKAGDPDCLRLMTVPLEYSSGFLAKTISGMRDLFSPRVPVASSKLMNTIDKWVWVLEQGVDLKNQT